LHKREITRDSTKQACRDCGPCGAVRDVGDATRCGPQARGIPLGIIDHATKYEENEQRYQCLCSFSFLEFPFSNRF